ncbi:MAG: leucyl aminopeptidase [Cyanobacteria bacterium REEB67]|nr:leucyl aminopeptidase [Cyanobacteria bacterium REEB67]
MQIKIENDASKSAAMVMVVGVHLNEALPKLLQEVFGNAASALDLASIAAAARGDGFKGKINQVFTFPTLGALPCKRILLYGLGAEAELKTVGYSGYRKIGANIAKRLAAVRRATATESNADKGASKGKSLATAGTTVGARSKALSACFYLRPRKGKATKAPVGAAIASNEQIVEAIVEAFIMASFSFEKYKSMKEAGKKARLENIAELSDINLYFVNCDKAAFEKAVNKAIAVGRAVNMSRELIAEPPAFMTPSRLAVEARRIAKDHDLSVKIFDEVQIAKLAMGSFLGVARGAKEPPRFIVLKYTAPKAKKTVAIVGKGVTFDSGGLSLKTAGGMEHMKYDMSGAAIVLGVMDVIGKLKPKVSVLCVVPATENMPGSAALHPGDVLIAMNGKTIEVNNTDAEGRLILADALTYACQQGADELIDIATLTGAVVSALGRAAAGIMGNNQDLIDNLKAAGLPSGEKYWQLPMFDEYKEALKSDVADLKNAGSRGEAGSSCAAMFLQEFVEEKPWAHMDIAGVAWTERERDELNKGGTAFGIRTLCSYLLSH